MIDSGSSWSWESNKRADFWMKLFESFDLVLLMQVFNKLTNKTQLSEGLPHYLFRSSSSSLKSGNGVYVFEVNGDEYLSRSWVSAQDVNSRLRNHETVHFENNKVALFHIIEEGWINGNKKRIETLLAFDTRYSHPYIINRYSRVSPTRDPSAIQIILYSNPFQPGFLLANASPVQFCSEYHPKCNWIKPNVSRVE